jgi:branched-chain amino acid aminotransferase
MEQLIYFDGEWYQENPKLIGPMNHAFWMASTVFDGARVFDGCAPDLDRHCQRLIHSAKAMMLEPTKTAEEVMDLCLEGARQFPKDSELYVRPMFYGGDGFIVVDPATTQFTLAIYQNPMPDFAGFSACWSSRRRPARDMAPTDAKASCLYANSGRAVKEAMDRGFDNAVMLDANGNVAEFASANIWIAKDGVAKTPAVTGAFLNGITRQTIIGLLREDGIEVEQVTLSPDDINDADEIFNTGNFGKVMPVVKFEDRDLQPGPIATRARELYWEYAKQFPVFTD